MKVFGLGLITLLIVSCSGKNDPMNVLEDHVEEDYARVIERGYKLLDVEKTNGIKGEFNGVERYRIEYKATFKSTFDGFMRVGTFNALQKPEDVRDPNDVEPSFQNLFKADTIEMTDKFQLNGYVVGNLKGYDNYDYVYLDRQDRKVDAYFLFKPVKKGIEITVEGRETLTKTDNGWQVE